MKSLKIAGGIDITVVFIIIAILFAALLSSGSVPKPSTTPPDGKYVPETPAAGSSHESLQLKYFTFKKVELPKGNACSDNPFNEEPDIIYASDPAFGGVAKSGGQIKIWVWEDDGNGGSVAPGEKVDETGKIITFGDRAAKDDNGSLWEPSIYITPLTAPDQLGPYAGDKENNGTPYFPSYIKGVANYGGRGLGDLNSVAIDPPVNITVKKTGTDWTFSEFIWDVNTLGLTTGYYRVQIILHDGDSDLAINCTTIQI